MAITLGPLGLAVGLASGLLRAGGMPPSVGRVTLFLVVAPILEEIVFRGGLQEWLRGHHVFGRAAGPLTGANLATSVVFAAAHGMSRGTPAALMVFFPSLVFGWFYDRDPRLSPVIGLHAFYNLLWLVATSR